MLKLKQNLLSYFSCVYALRFFLTHLVVLDLKNKFRRSRLGILWTFLSPLFLTMIMSIIFSIAFNSDIVTYAPYILSGILFWDVFSSAFQAGSSAIISNQFFIRQCNHPYSFYTLKSALVYVITFLIAILSLVIWMIFVNPLGIIYGLIFILPALIIYFFVAWAGTNIAAYVCAKYRDYPMVAPLVLQALWYVSPVFLPESVFKSNEYLLMWFNFNPITHLLNLIRNPFLENTIPTLEDYVISVLFAFLLGIFSILISKKMGKDIIFYL